MPITLLLDLDDTLLETNMDTFIPAYFKALSGALAEKVAPEVMIPALTGGTKAMMGNMDPALTLREVFDAWGFEVLNAIEEVSIDLWKPYKNLIEEMMPNAEAVADRFHVMTPLVL